MAENPPVFGSFGARKGRPKAVCPYMAIGNLPLLPDFLIQQAAGMFACFAPRLRPSPYTARSSNAKDSDSGTRTFQKAAATT